MFKGGFKFEKIVNFSFEANQVHDTSKNVILIGNMIIIVILRNGNIKNHWLYKLIFVFSSQYRRLNFPLNFHKIHSKSQTRSLTGRICYRRYPPQTMYFWSRLACVG